MKKTNQNEKMKPVTISFKTSEEIKAIIEKLAKKGYRSISQQVEMMVVEYLKSNEYLNEDGKPMVEKQSKK